MIKAEDCSDIVQLCIRKGVKPVIWRGRELDWVKPLECRKFFRGVGLKYLSNNAFDSGFAKLIRSYRPPKHFDIGLILPCTYAKPYRQSYVHYVIRASIKEYLLTGKIHEIMVTNAGVVPRELDEHWPYISYDWNPKYETKEIKECYVQILRCRLKRFLIKNLGYYSHIVAYLRWDSESWKAVRLVGEELNIDIPNLALKEVPKGEIIEAGLGGLYNDEDLILITESSLENLRLKIRRILS